MSGQSWWVLKLCAWGAFLHLSIYTISWSVTRAYCEWQDKKVERSCWCTRLRHWFPRQSSAANATERLSGTLLVHLHIKTFYRQEVNDKLIIKMRYQSHLGNAAVSILAVLYISVLYIEKPFSEMLVGFHSHRPCLHSLCVIRSQAVSRDQLTFTADIGVHLKYVSCAHLWLDFTEGKISDCHHSIHQQINTRKV